MIEYRCYGKKVWAVQVGSKTFLMLEDGQTLHINTTEGCLNNRTLAEAILEYYYSCSYSSIDATILRNYFFN